MKNEGTGTVDEANLDDLLDQQKLDLLVMPLEITAGNVNHPHRPTIELEAHAEGWSTVPEASDLAFETVSRVFHVDLHLGSVNCIVKAYSNSLPCALSNPLHHR